MARGQNPGNGHFLRLPETSQGDSSFVNSPSTPGNSSATSILHANPPSITPAVALDQDGRDSLYFSSVHVGSQKKTFNVIMDTGSSNFWIPSGTCRTVACRLHKTLSSSDSSTLQVSGVAWDIEYGTGDALGITGEDSVTLGGLTISRMAFGLATQISSEFIDIV